MPSNYILAVITHPIKIAKIEHSDVPNTTFICDFPTDTIFQFYMGKLICGMCSTYTSTILWLWPTKVKISKNCLKIFWCFLPTSILQNSFCWIRWWMTLLSFLINCFLCETRKHVKETDWFIFLKAKKKFMERKVDNYEF